MTHNKAGCGWISPPTYSQYVIVKWTILSSRVGEGSSCAEFRYAVVEGSIQQFILKEVVKAADHTENRTGVGGLNGCRRSLSTRSSSMSITAALNSSEFPVALGKDKANERK